MSKNEDYLDQLLNQFTKSGQAGSEEQLNQLSQELETDNKEVTPIIRNSEEDFIRQFESEMDEFNSERLISEFEMELDQTIIEPEEDNIDSDFFSGLNEVMGRKVSSTKEAVKEEIEKKGTIKKEVVHEEALKEEALQEKVPQKETSKDEIEDEFEQVKSEDESVDTPEIHIDTKDDETGIGEIEETKDEPLKARKQVDLDSDEDILDLLAGLAGDDEELSDIASMLKADENHEPIEADGILDMNVELKNITEIELEENLESGEIKKKKQKKKKEKNGKAKDDHSFLSKLSKILFGVEEVTAEEIALSNIPIRELDGTETPEELEILENLKNADIVVKTKEEQEKEEKKKIAAEKKAEKTKAAQEKKKEKEEKKAENKAKKAEKPEKIKPVDKTPPLPKMSVILIFLMSISFLVFILLATKGSGYQLAKNQTQAFYKEGNYVEAYSVIAGVDLKEADNSLREKVILLAGLQEEYRAQTTYFKAKKYEQALDALVRGIGRYYDGLERAKALNVVAEYGVVYAQLQESFNLNYKLTDDEALKLYKIRKRNLYSVEIVRIVEKLTFQ